MVEADVDYETIFANCDCTHSFSEHGAEHCDVPNCLCEEGWDDVEY
jgi:hypothetical protein